MQSSGRVFVFSTKNEVPNKPLSPNDLVTDNQFATLMLKTAGIPAVNTPEFDWHTCIDKGIITVEDARTMDFFTRGDMAKIIYEARVKGILQ